MQSSAVAPIAQLVEHFSLKETVPGPNPGGSIKGDVVMEDTFLNELRTIITDEFVTDFEEGQDFSGPIASLVAGGYLPDGVDANDPRVQEIIRKCQENRQ